MNNESSTFYQTIRDHLRIEFESKYRPGDVLPTEREFAERFDVNRHTLRRAFDELEREGWILRQRGRRARVLRPPISHSLSKHSDLTTDIEHIGLDAEAEVLNNQVVLPSPLVAERLRLRKNAMVVHLEVLFLADGEPVALANHHLPASKYAGAFEDYESGTVCAHFAREVGEMVERSKIFFRAELPSPHIARLLLVAQNKPISVLSSLNVLTKNKQPVEYVTHAFRSDSVELMTSF